MTFNNKPLTLFSFSQGQKPIVDGRQLVARGHPQNVAVKTGHGRHGPVSGGHYSANFAGGFQGHVCHRHRSGLREVDAAPLHIGRHDLQQRLQGLRGTVEATSGKTGIFWAAVEIRNFSIFKIYCRCAYHLAFLVLT